MAYTPINWQTGDTITAEKMNKMDNGWAIESSSQTYANESVTTSDSGYGNEGTLSYGSLITADTLKVTIDGIEYECQVTEVGGAYLYGGVTSSFEYDFTNYPFAIKSVPPPPFRPGGNARNAFATQTAGTYQVKVEGVSASLEVSDSFSDACNACVDTSTMPMLCVSGTTTYADMSSAIRSGRILFFQPYGSQVTTIRIITSFGNDSVTFFPTDANVQASFVDGVFTVTPA